MCVKMLQRKHWPLTQVLVSKHTPCNLWLLKPFSRLGKLHPNLVKRTENKWEILFHTHREARRCKNCFCFICEKNTLLLSIVRVWVYSTFWLRGRPSSSDVGRGVKGGAERPIYLPIACPRLPSAHAPGTAASVPSPAGKADQDTWWILRTTRCVCRTRSWGVEHRSRVWTGKKIQQHVIR